MDGMKTSQLGNYLAKYWPEIEQDLLNCKHQPLPVKRKEIPKPDGGVRLLVIPTVLDRFIQQAIAQILEQVWELFFSMCGQSKIRIHAKSMKRFKDKARELTSHKREKTCGKFT